MKHKAKLVYPLLMISVAHAAPYTDAELWSLYAKLNRKLPTEMIGYEVFDPVKRIKVPQWMNVRQVLFDLPSEKGPNAALLRGGSIGGFQARKALAQLQAVSPYFGFEGAGLAPVRVEGAWRLERSFWDWTTVPFQENRAYYLPIFSRVFLDAATADFVADELGRDQKPAVRFSIDVPTDYLHYVDTTFEGRSSFRRDLIMAPIAFRVWSADRLRSGFNFLEQQIWEWQRLEDFNDHLEQIANDRTLLKTGALDWVNFRARRILTCVTPATRLGTTNGPAPRTFRYLDQGWTRQFVDKLRRLRDRRELNGH